MNPLLREYRILWLKIRLRWWQWAEQNVHPCHGDVPLILRTQWGIKNRIRELEAQRGQY